MSEKPRFPYFGRLWRVSLPATIGVLYLPFSWLLLISYPWDGYRLFWIKLWTILPGFLVGMLLHPNDRVEFPAMALTTLALAALGTWIGSYGWRRLVVICGLLLALECYTSTVAYAVFRA